MKIKGIIDEDFLNYKKPSMYIAFPKCTFKCDKENKCQLCQNSDLVKKPDIEISVKNLVKRYLENPITKAIVCCGLEPIDSWDDLLELLKEFRKFSEDDFIIYTGYREEELGDKIKILSEYKNVIMKFGRFRPNQKSHYDEILGINLVNDEQHGKIIAKINER